MESNCKTMTGLLSISLREGRLMLDRALLQTGLPYGFNGAIRECVLTSEGIGLGGFRKFLDDYASFKRARPNAIVLDEQDAGMLFADCGGQHAWVVAQTLLDLLVDAARTEGRLSMRASNVEFVEELQVLAALGQRLGVRTEVSIDNEDAKGAATLSVLSLGMPPKEAIDPVLWKIIREGLPVDAQVWWRIYHLALDALSPDTVVSRRHAGANYIDENGKLVGRPNDDDTDLSLLKESKAATTAKAG
jgi:hypothetical protein